MVFIVHLGNVCWTSPQRGSVDAAVLLHGLAGNFYSSRLLFHFAETLRQLGINVVVVNTRGHDMINTSTWGGRARSVGAALENIDDCRLDVNAWVDFLIENAGLVGIPVRPFARRNQGTLCAGSPAAPQSPIDRSGCQRPD